MPLITVIFGHVYTWCICRITKGACSGLHVYTERHNVVIPWRKIAYSSNFWKDKETEFSCAVKEMDITFMERNMEILFY